MRRMGLAVILLIPAAVAWGQDAGSAEAAKKAAAHLVGLQGGDGSFKFQAKEQHFDGIESVIGLALLSELGFAGPVEKYFQHALNSVGGDGNPGARTYKSDFENGWIATFLAEVALQDKYGKIKLEAGVRDSLKKKIEAMVGYFVKKQDSTGIWVYTGGGLSGYKETAVMLGILNFYKMAEALGISVNQESVTRAWGFARSRWKSGGFVNGDLEKEASIHLTPAVLSVMNWYSGNKDMIDAANAYDAKREQSGYITQWKYDEYDAIPQNLQGQAKSLVERRQMFGTFHLCLSYLRAKNSSKFSDIHKKVCQMLLANSQNGTWNSTIGTGGATAFGLLTLNLAKKECLIFFAPDPKNPKGGGGAGGAQAWFGAQLEKVDGGVKVKAVQGSTTATVLGIQKDDVITMINDTAITEPAQVGEIIGGLAPNAEVKCKFKRGGKDQEKKGKVQKIPAVVLKWDDKKKADWY